MVLFRLFLGIALLVGGSRLFWLFLGSVGFIFAFDFAERTIHNQPHSVIFIIALFAGALGGMAAILLQKYAVLAGGFLAGGYFLIEPLDHLRCWRSGRSCPYECCVWMGSDYYLFPNGNYSHSSDLSFPASGVRTELHFPCNTGYCHPVRIYKKEISSIVV